ncbi:MAG: amidase [Chloroflexi bacterium]|nr:MAG: amidase [Chloroflexota bacterium]
MKASTTTKLWGMGAAELAVAIRQKQVSSREVITAYLARIDAVNPPLNAITRVLGEEALAAADSADKKLAAGEKTGPLHGVPFTVKENIDLAGSATTQGVAALAEADPGLDAPQVANLREAGAIPMARTNLPDFALRWHTDNKLRGATRNPWDPKRTPGGSSGGEAVALATGMTPLGLGNDLGGSLRWPSQCNGTSALRPSLGRVPRATTIEPVDGPISFQLMYAEGPMARHVADLRVALEVMARPSWRDPWHAPVPMAGPPPSRPIRVAMVVDPAGKGTSPQVADGVRRAGKQLAAAGYAVDQVEPPAIEEAAEVWANFLIPEVRAMWPMISPIVSDDANRFMGLLFDVNPVLDFGGHMQTMIARQSLARKWAEFQLEHPLILAPVCTEPPFPVGTDLTPEGVAGIVRSMRIVVAVNLLGLPAAAVPVGVAEGLPQEVQVIGPRFREDLCLDAAEVLEQAFGTLTPID